MPAVNPPEQYRRAILERAEIIGKGRMFSTKEIVADVCREYDIFRFVQPETARIYATVTLGQAGWSPVRLKKSSVWSKEPVAPEVGQWINKSDEGIANSRTAREIIAALAYAFPDKPFTQKQARNFILKTTDYSETTTLRYVQKVMSAAWRIGIDTGIRVIRIKYVGRKNMTSEKLWEIVIERQV